MALPMAESLARHTGAHLDVVSLTSPGIEPLPDMAEARVSPNNDRSPPSRGAVALRRCPAMVPP
jgi:hypothetical protein